MRLAIAIGLGLAGLGGHGCGGPATAQPERSTRAVSRRAETANPPPGYDVPDLSNLTDFQALVESFRPYAPCRGAETLRREVFEQAWIILGDDLRVELWPFVLQYFQLAGNADDVDRLIHFVTQSYDGPLGDSADPEWRRQSGFEMGVFAIGSLGARLQEDGAGEAAERALSFLLDCADMGFWRSSGVSWHARPGSWGHPEERLAVECVMEAGLFPSPAAMARLERRRGELVGRGAWSERLEGGMDQARADHQKVVGAGGPRAFMARTIGFCPDP